jgi:hypothetical protein
VVDRIRYWVLVDPGTQRGRIGSPYTAIVVDGYERLACRRYASDGTWDRIHGRLLAEADAVGQIGWTVSVESTINRAPQHGTNLPRTTGGTPELQEAILLNPRTTPSDAPKADWAPRSIAPVTVKAARWR